MNDGYSPDLELVEARVVGIREQAGLKVCIPISICILGGS